MTYEGQEVPLATAEVLVPSSTVIAIVSGQRDENEGLSLANVLLTVRQPYLNSPDHHGSVSLDLKEKI